MKLIDLLSSSGYIVVNKGIIKELGVESAIVFGELCSEYQYFASTYKLDEDGYFYSTIGNIERNTGLGRRQQTNAINNMQQRGLIDVKIKGMPAQRFFRINEDAVEELISVCTFCTNLFAQNEQTGLHEMNKLHNITYLSPYSYNKNNNNINNNKLYRTTDDERAHKPLRPVKKEFEELWSIYPRKEGKRKAEEAYIRAAKDGVEFETVKRGIENYKAHILAQKLDTRYIKLGQTYFCGRCWEDEYGTTVSQETSCGKSFDTDDFFAAALKKSYENKE